MDDGGRGVKAGCIRIRCPSPRRIVSRWFSPYGKDKGKKKKTQMEEERVRDCEEVRIRSCSDDNHGVGDDTTPRIIDSGSRCLKGKKKTHMEEARVRIRSCSDDNHGVGDDTTPQIIDSDLQRREFLFSIGVSCYLLQLIDTGREEIHKIVQLRNELEKFLECHNEELRRNQQGFVELRNNIERFLEFDNDELRQKQQNFQLGKQVQSVTSAYSTTSDVVDGPESSTDQYYSPQIPESSMGVGVEGSLQSNYVGDDFVGEMDQLEAEFQAELELLQIGQDQDGKFSKLKDGSEKSEDSEGPVEEQQGVCPYELERRLQELIETRQKEEIKKLEIALEWDQDGKFSKHNEDSEKTEDLEPVVEQQGVCPYELERRLHELVEIRQKEAIQELEIALEEAKQKLNLKKTEASWWKDTAYIVSKRIPETSKIKYNSQTYPYPVSR